MDHPLLHVSSVYQVDRPAQRANFLNTLKQHTLEGCSIFGEMFASTDERDRTQHEEFHNYDIARSDPSDWFHLFLPIPDPNMGGSRVIGIRWATIGSGIEAIGRARHIRAVVGGLLVMSVGNTLKVIGKEIAAGGSITTTGTGIETGIIVRKSGIRTMIASSGLNNRFDIYVSSFTPVDSVSVSNQRKERSV